MKIKMKIYDEQNAVYFPLVFEWDGKSNFTVIEQWIDDDISCFESLFDLLVFCEVPFIITSDSFEEDIDYFLEMLYMEGNKRFPDNFCIDDFETNVPCIFDDCYCATVEGHRNSYLMRAKRFEKFLR